MLDEAYYYNKADSKTDWFRGNLKKALEFIKDKAEKRKVGNMLEVGCGFAKIADFLPAQVRYFGLDPSEYAISRSKEKYPGYDFIVGRAEEMPFNNNFFDIVFSHQVVEMLVDPRKGLKEMMRVVKPGGYVMIIAPNLELPWSEVRAARHYSAGGRFILRLERWFDLLLRIFRVLKFRVIPQNYVEATGRFEKGDEELKYIASAYEVATFFKRNGFREIIGRPEQYPNSSLKNIIKNILMKMPVFKYYGGGMFFIFQKC